MGKFFNRRLGLTVIAALLALVLVSCANARLARKTLPGVKNTSGGPLDPSNEGAPALVGTWKTACIDDPDFSNPFKLTLIFRGSQMTYAVENFETSDSQCLSSAISVDQTVYAFSTGEPVVSPENAWELNLEPTNGPGKIYTIYSIVPFNPPELKLGYYDKAGSVYDGSSPDKRPIEIYELGAFVQQ